MKIIKPKLSDSKILFITFSILLLFAGIISAYEYKYRIDIPIENKNDIDIASLIKEVGDSTIDIKTSINIKKGENIQFYIAKKKISPDKTITFEIEIKNDDMRDQENLELRIFILNPYQINRGDKSLDLYELKKENKLIAGEKIVLPYIYYQIPTNAREGEWNIYSVIYKKDKDSKEKIPIAVSKESFEVYYGKEKWIPIVLFVIITIVGSTWGDRIINNVYIRVLVALILGALAYFFWG